MTAKYFVKTVTRFVCVLSLWGLLFTSFAWAQTHEVKMLNKGAQGSMVFEPSLLKAKVGDTVVFEPVSKGHNTQSVFTPDQANTWSGKTDETVSVVLNQEGVYIYACSNHGIMAMVGVIEVGSSSNLAQAKEFAQTYKKNFISNKDRLDQYLEKIK